MINTKKIFVLFLLMLSLVNIASADSYSANITNMAMTDSANPNKNYFYGYDTGGGINRDYVLGSAPTYKTFVEVPHYSNPYSSKWLYLSRASGPAGGVTAYINTTTTFNERTLTHANAPSISGPSCATFTTSNVSGNFIAVNITGCSGDFLAIQNFAASSTEFWDDETHPESYVVYNDIIPITETSINFDQANYSLSGTATITYGILNPDFYNYYYLAKLENPAGQVISTSAMSVGSSNPSSFTNVLDTPGTWRANLWQCQLSNSECNVFLGYDIANVSSTMAAQGGSISFYSDILETNRITAIDTGNTAFMHTSVDNIDTSKYTYQVLISNQDSVGVDYENVIVSPQSFIIDTSYSMYIRSGAYTFRLVSSNIITGASQTLATATLAILDDYPGSGYLNFSKANYNLGEQMSIGWNISNGNFSKYAYSIELFGTDGSLQRVIGINSASGTTSPPHDMTKTGSYSAWLYAQKYGSVSKQLITIAQTQYGSIAGGVTGNLSLDKSTYNRTETVQISYNISTNGRLDIQTPTTMYSYAVSAGTNQHSTFYIPQDAAFGTYTIYLEYFDGLVWTYIDHETFTVTYIGQNMIEFSDPRKLYVQGDTMIVNAIGIDAGYVKITDSNGMIKLNATISANSLTSYNYYVAFTDPAGIWTAKLYNSTGAEVASDSADVYTSGYGQPSPTATVPSVTSTSGTIDYVGNKTARKQAENSFLNTFYSGMNALFTLAILATIMFLLKDMAKWR